MMVRRCRGFLLCAALVFAVLSFGSCEVSDEYNENGRLHEGKYHGSGVPSESAGGRYVPGVGWRADPAALPHAQSHEPPPGFQNLKVVNGEEFGDMYFKHYGVNPTIDTSEEKFSTFSVDVDTASFAMARSYLENGALPPDEAIRIEEFVNAFDYNYPAPRDAVFQLQAEAVPSPSRPGYHLLHVGIKGREIRESERRPANLVFVIDTSGSMQGANRLGLVKQSLRILLDHLRGDDTVGIVVYGSRGRVVLNPTSIHHRRRILDAIEELRTGGSTNALEGLELGYQMAERNFIARGTNRIILCSDGVANTGDATSASGIAARVHKAVQRGITISTIGYGMGNYNDILMEQLAQQGHGNYHYIASEAAARELFGQKLTSMLEVIAADVKLQLEFDSRRVSRYRLLGYENRRLESEQFQDDLVDAGEVGPGHSVTALYEVKLIGGDGDLGWLRVRYKEPGRESSKLLERALRASIVKRRFADCTGPFRVSAAVALFAEKLRNSYWVRQSSYDHVLDLLKGIPSALRQRPELVRLKHLVTLARKLDQRDDKFAPNTPDDRMQFDRVPILR